MRDQQEESITYWHNGEKRIYISINQTRFNAGIYREFSELVESQTPATKYTIDFKRVSDVDSSTLGMLLMLHDANGYEQGNIRLINCQGRVASLFRAANFHKLFEIDIDDMGKTPLDIESRSDAHSKWRRLIRLPMAGKRRRATERAY